MNKKIILGVVVLASIVVSVFYIKFYDVSSTRNISDTKDDNQRVKSLAGFKWRVKDKGVDDITGAQKNDLFFSIEGKGRYVGMYEGSCSPINNKTWKLLPNEKVGMICYFAGSGKEVGIFEEDGGFVVKRGIIEEGGAEVSGSRDQFVTLFKI